MQDDRRPDTTPEEILDQYFVVLSQAGVTEALDRLARRWTPRLLRYTSRLLSGSANAVEVARDVVQDTWLSAVRGLRGLRDPAHFGAWIYGIATRRCADEFRNRVRRSRLVDIAIGNPGAGHVEALERGLDLAAAIRTLPAEQRTVVELFYGEDLSVEEIALALMIPRGTVKSRLYHARETLTRYLSTDTAEYRGGHLERTRSRHS